MNSDILEPEVCFDESLNKFYCKIPVIISDKLALTTIKGEVLHLYNEDRAQLILLYGTLVRHYEKQTRYFGISSPLIYIALASLAIGTLTHYGRNLFQNNALYNFVTGFFQPVLALVGISVVYKEMASIEASKFTRFGYLTGFRHKDLKDVINTEFQR